VPGSLSADAIARIRSALEDVPGVAAAWVFGSVARGTARADSDIDFGVLLTERGAEKSLAPRWLGDLASRLETATGRTVDLVMVEAQGPILRHRILKEGVLVFDANRERRIDFESDTISRYLDFAPTFERAARHTRRGFLDWLERRP
jgi:predicted nucleotidyltransferase